MIGKVVRHTDAKKEADLVKELSVLWEERLDHIVQRPNLDGAIELFLDFTDNGLGARLVLVDTATRDERDRFALDILDQHPAVADRNARGPHLEAIHPIVEADHLEVP